MNYVSKIILLVVLSSPLLVCAQNKSSDVNKIETLVHELYRAMVEQDQAVLEKLTSENLSYGHSSGAIENRSEYVEAVMTGPFKFISIVPNKQTISISGETAIVRHIFDAKGKNDGSPVNVHIGVLMALQKHNGKWKLLARQAYKL